MLPCVTINQFRANVEKKEVARKKEQDEYCYDRKEVLYHYRGR